MCRENFQGVKETSYREGRADKDRGGPEVVVGDFGEAVVEKENRNEPVASGKASTYKLYQFAKEAN